jgi:hypothetical protein
MFLLNIIDCEMRYCLEKLSCVLQSISCASFPPQFEVTCGRKLPVGVACSEASRGTWNEYIHGKPHTACLVRAKRCG